MSVELKKCFGCKRLLPAEGFALRGVNTRNKLCLACMANPLWSKPASVWRAGPRQRMLSRAKKRAALKGIEFSITKNDIHIPAVCPLLGMPLAANLGYAKDNSPSLDRINPALGYVRGNVWVISMKANRMKGDLDLAMLNKLAYFMSNPGLTSVSN